MMIHYRRVHASPAPHCRKRWRAMSCLCADDKPVRLVALVAGTITRVDIITAMDFPRFTDLRAMADDLSSDPRYSRLVPTIRSMLHAQSCVSDLGQSKDALEALEVLAASPRKKGTIGRGATESALLTTAVLLYARATSTSGKQGERGSIRIEAHLTPDQLADHEVLLGIRNRALAHVYTEEPIDQQIWHSERAFAVELGEGWIPACGGERVQLNFTVMARLRRQLPVARSILHDRYQEHVGKMVKLMADEPVPLETFVAHCFDPVPVFGSEQAVAEVLAGMGVGRASVLVERPANPLR